MMFVFALFLISLIGLWNDLEHKTVAIMFIQLFIPLIRWTVFLFILVYFLNYILVILKGDDSSGN